MNLSDEGVHAVLSCVARSCSTIRTLDISLLAFDSGYHRLRTSLPTVTHLCLAWPGMLRRDYEQNSFFAAMKSGSCLPNLESLTWNRCSPYGAEQLFTMISARWCCLFLSSRSSSSPSSPDSGAKCYVPSEVSALAQLLASLETFLVLPFSE